ncbi:mitochondrial carrier domain-containing protein, partial [Mycena leptocephala]
TLTAVSSAPQKKQPYSFWLGGVAATIAASITHPLALTKVRLQVSGNKHMVDGIKKTYRTAGMRGLAGRGCTRCSKKFLGAGKDVPVWKLALAGAWVPGGIAGFVGNPGEIIMVRLQGDFAKPPEKQFTYKNCFDALFRMLREEGPSSLVRGVGPNVFRAVLMNASQLASYDFKAEAAQDEVLCG